MTNVETGVDKALSLDAVYYSAPIPRNLGSLTVLGAVFDTIQFPGVCMPREFDQAELDREIARIEELHQHSTSKLWDTQVLLSVMKFVKHVKTLDGLCVFTGDHEKPFQHDAPMKLVNEIHQALHGPNPPGWNPTFFNTHHKAMPGSQKEHLTYPGDLHYPAGAIIHSAKTQIPLVNDMPGLPIPGLDVSTAPFGDARLLSAILAIECVKVALPELPLLSPSDLMEFRAENSKTLRAFRRSMLRYAADLNDKIKGMSRVEFESAARFFVQTEIVPALDELRSTFEAPATSWYRRAINGFRVLPRLAISVMMMDQASAIATVFATYADQFFDEFGAQGDKETRLKRSGLYYLLQLQARSAGR